jgi:hypothetical protein
MHVRGFVRQRIEPTAPSLLLRTATSSCRVPAASDSASDSASEYASLFRPNTYGILGWPEFELFADRRPGMPPDESSPPSLSTVPLVGSAVNARCYPPAAFSYSREQASRIMLPATRYSSADNPAFASLSRATAASGPSFNQVVMRSLRRPSIVTACKRAL